MKRIIAVRFVLNLEFCSTGINMKSLKLLSISILVILFQFNVPAVANETTLVWTTTPLNVDLSQYPSLGQECDPTYFICSTFNLDNFPPELPYYQRRIFAFAPGYMGLSNLSTLEDTARQVIADELGVKVDPIFLDAARGQVKALVYVSLLNIIKKPASERTANEQGVYDYFQTLVRTKRLDIANRAQAEYDKWFNNPCGYQIPVGDDPNAYLDDPNTQSYCEQVAAGNTLATLLTYPPAIAGKNYFSWVEQMYNIDKVNGLYTQVAGNCGGESWCSEPTKFKNYFIYSLGNSYSETIQAMAFLKALGKISNIETYDYQEYLSNPELDSSLASGMRNVLEQFQASYTRDVLGGIIVELIAKGPSSLLPDDAGLWLSPLIDTGIFAVVGLTSASMEIADQADAPNTIQTAFDKVNQSLETIISTGNGRSELFLDFIELTVPDGWRKQNLPSYNNPLSGLFWSSLTPDENFININDWGKDLSNANAINQSIFTLTDQGWLSHVSSLYGSSSDPDLYYPGYTSSIRFIDDKGDFKTAWLIKSTDGKTRQFIVTPYAAQIRDDSGVAATVSASQLYNSDCPAAGTYNFNSPPVDHGLSCITSSNGVPVTNNLQPGDNVIIAGQFATVDLITSPTSFTLTKPLTGAMGATLHKVNMQGGEQVPVNEFNYGFNGGPATAILAAQNVPSYDRVPPVITIANPAITIEANAVYSSVNLGSVTATDNLDGNIAVTSNAPAGFPLGTTVVTYSATDSSGNVTTATQSVTVVDTTPPRFTAVPAAVTFEATGEFTPVLLVAPVASDIFGITYSNNVPAQGFGLGTHVVTWTAFDSSGNTATISQSVTVVDTTPPVISIANPNITIEANAVDSVVDLGSVTAVDLVDGTVDVTNDAPAAFPLGNTVVTYTSADSHSNIATATQTVTVVDTTPPVFTVLPVDIDQIASSEQSTVNLGNVEATDIFGATITNNAPATFPVGTTVVTWTATDPSGNVATATQRVTLSYQFSGITKPLMNGGVYKANRTLPIKFQLTYADGTLASAAVATLSVYQLSAGEVTGDSLDVSSNANADTGNQFRYADGYYIFNLKTQDMSIGTYRLSISLNDGKQYSIDIALK